MASELDPQNPDYYFLIAYYLAEYEYESSQKTAINEYKQALTLSPFNYNYWFGVAELFYAQGERDKALYSLNKAASLSPGSVSLRWKAGMLASKLGERELVLDNLRSVIEHDRNRRKKAFVLLWQSIGDGDRIFDAVSDNALSQYFYYLRVTGRINETGRVYEKMKELNYDTSVAAYKYTADLITKGDFDSAINVWEGEYGEWDGVWNGSFDLDMRNDGFDWRLRMIDGLKIKRDMDSRSGKYAVKISFEDIERTDFSSLHQIIPVEGGSDYTISLYVKADEIITSEDLVWNVYCLNSGGLNESSYPIYGTHDWKPYTISFSAPEDCRAVFLQLIRPSTGKVNKHLSGTLWVDDVSMSKTKTIH